MMGLTTTATRRRTAKMKVVSVRQHAHVTILKPVVGMELTMTAILQLTVMMMIAGTHAHASLREPNRVREISSAVTTAVATQQQILIVVADAESSATILRFAVQESVLSAAMMFTAMTTIPAR